LDRLLIDLSWNSSRLEGNTYSLLDTKRLIAFGKEAQGKDRVEAQMILNHKDAIEFLVDNADEIGFNRFTIRNLHGVLANNLLPDPQAAGRLRQIEVEIGQSAFRPLAVPQLIEECFNQILDTAMAISDPFEQSFFIMVHLPYLQPFEDVNKRVSRLAANISLIKANLVPLTFADVPKDLYVQATLGVYELNKVELLRDIYLWAYKRSAERYAAVRQSLGEPDPFRLNHRDALRQVVGTIVRDKLNRAAAFKYLETWTAENLVEDERDEFQRVAEDEILALHEGNFARYQVRPSEFDAWRKVWDRHLKSAL
jgi:fido (protein-threonine AMPylation protein)